MKLGTYEKMQGVMVSNAKRVVEKASRVCGIVATGTLMGMMFLTVVSVFGRKFLSSPIPGDVELIEMAMVCTGFLGIAWCAIMEKHVQVDILISRFSNRAQHIVRLIGYGIALVTAVIIAWRSFVEGVANRELGRTSPSLSIPIFPFYWMVGFGYTLLCFTLFVLILKSLTGMRKQ